MRLALLLPLLLLVACANDAPRTDAPRADGQSASTLAVTDAWARPGLGTDTTRVTTAAYFTLSNDSETEVRLLSVGSDAAERVELHETTMEDGMMRMRPIDGLAVPANGSVELRPGGPHVMLIGLTRDLAEGDTVSLTLDFAHGETLTVETAVRPATL